MSDERVRRSRDDVRAYIESFGLPRQTLDSLAGTFDFWHERRRAVEDEVARMTTTTRDWQEVADALAHCLTANMPNPIYRREHEDCRIALRWYDSMCGHVPEVCGIEPSPAEVS